jgi:pyruvate-formate lyase-activating enzyme
MHAIWDGDRAIIGPEPRIGVTGSGVYERENIESDWFNWTNGDARFDVPITTDVELDTLVIGLSQLNRFERSCRILVNDQIGFEGRVDPSSAQIPISLKGLRPTDRLTINIFSDAVVNSQTSRKEGVPVTWIALQKSPSPISNPVKKVIGSRLSRPGLWYNNKELVFEELLANPEKLRRFYVTGGEPMIEPRFVSIIDFFVERGVAGNIALELTTNCTVVNKRLLSQFKEFKSLLLTVSLDGIEEVQEYMRYPSRWEIIKRNIHILRETGFAIIAVPVVQAYNMLSLVDIAKFSRQVGIEVSFMNNLCWPAHLATGVMPKNVHELAARRLREYARKIEDDRSAICMHGQISSLADMFEGFDGPADHAALRTFNLFTNDLDLSRGQNFKKSLPELYNLILESGYEWTESALHAHSQFERRPSRERVHQWV